MPDEIRIDEDQRIAYVRSYGDVTRADIDSSIAVILEAFTAGGVDKVLVDVTGQTSLPGSFNLYEIFSHFPREIRAALISSEQPTSKDIRFIETVASNRALTFQVFSDRENALSWLLQ